MAVITVAVVNKARIEATLAPDLVLPNREGKPHDPGARSARKWDMRQIGAGTAMMMMSRPTPRPPQQLDMAPTRTGTLIPVLLIISPVNWRI